MLRTAPMRFEASIVLSLSLLIFVGCSSDPEPLERTFGIVGTSYCDEVNIVFGHSLHTHIARTESDKDALYTASLSMMLENLRSAIPTAQMQEDTQAAAAEFFNNGVASADHLQNCEHLLTIQNILDNNRIGRSSDIDPSVRSPAVFRLFLKSFAKSLDYFSDYFPPGESARPQTYGFGINLNLSLASWYNAKLDSAEVYAVDLPDNILKIHDEILEVGQATQSQAEADFYPMKPIKTLLEENVSTALQSTFSFAPGPLLKVKVKRASNGAVETLTLSRRESNRTPVVSTEIVNGNVIYARLQEFVEGAAPELLRKLLATRAELRAATSPDKIAPVILDLRWNRGGYINELQDIAAIFLPPGDFGRIKRRDGPEVTETVFRIKKIPEFEHEPLIVLINHGSASASDILTQLLKESERAFIIGEESFGKGIGQETNKLDLIGGAFKITNMQFYGPSGESIQARGNKVNLKVVDPKIESLKNSCGPKCIFKMTDIPSRTGLAVPPTGASLKPIEILPTVTKTNFASSRIDAALSEVQKLAKVPSDIVLETSLQILKQTNTP